MLFTAFLVILMISLPAGAAEQEKEAWEYGTITGQARFYYFTQRNKTTGNSFDNIQESLATGGYLKYETPWLSDHFGADRKSVV